MENAYFHNYALSSKPFTRIHIDPYYGVIATNFKKMLQNVKLKKNFVFIKANLVCISTITQK